MYKQKALSKCLLPSIGVKELRTVRKLFSSLCQEPLETSRGSGASTLFPEVIFQYLRQFFYLLGIRFRIIPVFLLQGFQRKLESGHA